jgi:hypothetical protein
VLRVQDPEKAARIPSGLELRERWRGVVVGADELTSDAELAIRRGDP